MSRKTPAKSPRAKTAASPMRITRLEEKTQLQELNARLEHYILKQRERDASQGSVQGEIDALKRLYDEETENLRNDYGERLEKLRAERDEASTLAARLEDENRRLKKSVDNNGEETAQLNDNLDRLREQIETTTAAKDELERRVAKETELRSSLQQELERTKRKVTDLTQQLAEAQETAEDAGQRAADAEGRLRGLEDDLANERKRADREIGRLRDEVASLTSKVTQVEDITRKEFVKQLEELVDKRQAEFEKDKDEALEQLKEIYDEKLNGYREQLERAGHELEEARKRAQDAKKIEETARTEIKEAQEIKITFEKRVEELERIVAEEQARPNIEIAELKEINRRLKASFKRKDKEFDDLLDVKIALAMEIKQYRELLEKEEERLGYSVAPSPEKKGKKRRRRARKDEEEEEAPAPAEESALVFSSMDVDGEFVTVRNNSTDDVPLKGWSIQTEKAKKEFLLPQDATLGTGQSITIHTVRREAADTDTDVTWVDDGVVFDASGDKFLLVDPNSHIVHEKDIMPTKPVVGGAEGQEQNGDNKQCTVM